MTETMAVRTGRNVQCGARRCNRNTSCYAATLPISSAESKRRATWKAPLLVSRLARRFHGRAKIDKEAFVFAFGRFFIRLPQQRGRVNCCQNSWRKLRRQNFAALPRDAGGRAEDGLRGGRAETD